MYQSGSEFAQKVHRLQGPQQSCDRTLSLWLPLTLLIL